MMTETSNNIIEYIKRYKQVRPHDLANIFNISAVAVHKQLRKLVDAGKIKKLGKPPYVYYVTSQQTEGVSHSFPTHIQEQIDQRYLYISPRGELLYGVEGFNHWVAATKQQHRIEQLATEYIKVRSHADTFFSKQKWINATNSKMVSTFHDHNLFRLLYGDFYSLPIFGKTKLGQLMLYAKQSQSKELTDKVIEIVRPLINKVIETYNIDTVAFIPPSIPRTFQFMTEFAERLNLPLSRIHLIKTYTGDVIVAQKTLSRLEERIENAQQTIFVDTQRSPVKVDTILLIDDAVGSGSTLHEVSKKIKDSYKQKVRIIGFAIVGSMKGFEVLREI